MSEGVSAYVEDGGEMEGSGEEEGVRGVGVGTWQSLGISGSLRPGKRSIFNCYC